MGGASVAVWVTAAPEGNAATFCFPGTRACAAMVWRWLSRRREMWGRSGDVADDNTGRRVFAGASTEFGTTSEAAGGVSEVSTGGASATTFGGAERKAGVTGAAIGLSSAGATGEVRSALRCSRCTSGAADCVGRDSTTDRSERPEGDVGLFAAGV